MIHPWFRRPTPPGSRASLGIDPRRVVTAVVVALAIVVGGFGLAPAVAGTDGGVPGPGFGYDAVAAGTTADAGGGGVLEAATTGVSLLAGPPPVHLRRASELLAPRGLGGLSDEALAFATRAEKLDHIFVARHNLDPLVTQLGSREAVVEQMLRGVGGRTPAAGVFELTTDIAGQQVVVRGAVVDGVMKLGTAFTP